MIQIDSNIDKVLKSLKEKQKKLRIVISRISKIVAEQIKQDMIREIELTRSQWSESYERIGGVVNPSNQITVNYNINGARISIGNSAEKLVMADGGTVNPYYFIEFGFGVIGETSPAKNSSIAGWEYNINKHSKGWYFTGTDEKSHKSYGRIGINFMYNAVQKNKHKWQTIVINEFKKEGI